LWELWSYKRTHSYILKNQKARKFWNEQFKLHESSICWIKIIILIIIIKKFINGQDVDIKIDIPLNGNSSVKVSKVGNINEKPVEKKNENKEE